MNKSENRAFRIFLFMVAAAWTLPFSSSQAEAQGLDKENVAIGADFKDQASDRKITAKSTPAVQIRAVSAASLDLNHIVPTDTAFTASVTSEDQSLPEDGWKWTSSAPKVIAVVSVPEGKSTSCTFRTAGTPGKVTLTARNGSMKAQYTMSVQCTETREKWELFREELFYQYLSPSESSLEKCLKIARWLCDYATCRPTDDSDMFVLMQTHYGYYTHYAQIFAFLAEGAGIPVQVAQDDAYMWNQVEIDGHWYNVDVAGMDKHDSVGSYSYGYFLVSDALFWRKDQRKSGTSCTSTRFDFEKTSPENSPWASGEWKKI